MTVMNLINLYKLFFYVVQIYKDILATRLQKHNKVNYTMILSFIMKQNLWSPSDVALCGNLHNLRENKTFSKQSNSRIQLHLRKQKKSRS